VVASGAGHELTPLSLDMTPLLVVLTPHTVQLLNVFILMIGAETYVTSVWCRMANSHIFVGACKLVSRTFRHLNVVHTSLRSEVEEVVHPHGEEVHPPAGVVAKVGFDLVATIIVSVELSAVHIDHLVVSFSISCYNTAHKCDDN